MWTWGIAIAAQHPTPAMHSSPCSDRLRIPSGRRPDRGPIVRPSS